jgi:hypothetical protein
MTAVDLLRFARSMVSVSEVGGIVADIPMQHDAEERIAFDAVRAALGGVDFPEAYRWPKTERLRVLDEAIAIVEAGLSASGSGGVAAPTAGGGER